MCGRYTLSDPGTLLDQMEVHADGADLTPRFNMAPTQSVPSIRQGNDGVKHLSFLRWGLIPFWAKDPSIGNRMINARSETAAEKPSFKHAIKRRRCLLMADGFYEWQKVADGKQPIHIHMPDRRAFVLAGLWERWDRGPEPIESCTILTTRANEQVAEVHDRMPVILEGDARDVWLDGSIQDPASFEPLFEPFGSELSFTPVSRFVNNPRHDSPQCIEPI